MQIDTFDMLSFQKTKAEFVGVRHIPCRFMTALCPDLCGHASDVADFKILEVEHFESIKKDAAPPQSFSVTINPKITPTLEKQEIQNVIKELKIGQKVQLNWAHIYCNKNGNHFPELPTLKLEIIE